MPTSTTAPRKTYSPAAVDKACKQVRTRTLEEFADSDFLAVVDLACKLFTKYLKEELDK